MEFDNNKPIYLQIYDGICNGVLSGALPEGERIQSVRDYGAQIGVNPNTVVRTYEKLTQDEIIYNKRGIGYFVSEGARKKILKVQRRIFMTEELPRIRERLRLLELDPSEIFSHPSPKQDEE